MDTKFLNSPISERNRIIREDKDPIHIYELFQKHFNQSIDELKLDYRIELNIVRSRILIYGNDEEKIYELFLYLKGRGVILEGEGLKWLRIDLNHFLNKIY